MSKRNEPPQGDSDDDSDFVSQEALDKAIALNRAKKVKLVDPLVEITAVKQIVKSNCQIILMNKLINSQT